MSFPINVVVAVEGMFTEFPELQGEDIQRGFSVRLSAEFSKIFGRKIEEVMVSFTSTMTPTVSVPSGIFVYYPESDEPTYRAMGKAVESARNSRFTWFHSILIQPGLVASSLQPSSDNDHSSSAILAGLFYI